MVSKASEDLPEPESPVNTTSWSRGISRSMFLRLCSRAPRIAITRAPSADAWRRGRPWSKRSFIRSVGAIIWGGQGGHIDEAKESIPAQLCARKPPKERSKNGGVSLARRAARAPPSSSCGQHRRARCWPRQRGGSPSGPPRGSRFPKCTNPIIPWGSSPPRRTQRHCRGSFNEGRHRIHPRQLHADVFRAGPARVRHRALAGAPTAQLCADRRSAVLVFRAVLDRIFKPLQFRLARLFRETGGELHRLGGQSLPVGGGLCQPRLCAGGIVGVQGKLRFAARGNRRACRLSLGRGRRSRLSDDHGAQFRARQCRRHFLQRYLGSDGRLHISVAATPRGPIAAAKVSVKAKTPVEAVALSGR